ncbi:DNA-binding response OmpR family regulator [Chryseobacterium sp. PvR013]|uniref:hypothetical protein n=1 Tax=Chryseobacterium sp. PvR013 TaxID=2806595 RepID=UPI001AEB40A2|nr:hypothetical protein [Chryseobacterium sp. PvR013]MBP1163888.1 DNA-binding response OmpR family regulator [Chryseobacterium sp. PvR013]
MGADDYLTKPFYLSELMTRVYSIIRRKQFRSSNVAKQNELQIDLLREKNKSKNALSSTMVMPFYQNKTVGIGLVKTF